MMSEKPQINNAIVPYNPDEDTSAIAPIKDDDRTLAQTSDSDKARLKSALSGTRRLQAPDPNQGLPRRIQFHIRESGETLELPVTSRTIMIGRRNSNMPVDIDLADFNAHDMGVSRNHLSIETQGGQLIAKDLNSVNGSFINGNRMRPLSVYYLRHSDELKLGRIHVKVYFIY